MITTPRGSYAAHQLVSRYDDGPRAGHTLDGFHAERRPIAAILFALAVFTLLAGWVLHRGGAVDHETRTVVEVVR